MVGNYYEVDGVGHGPHPDDQFEIIGYVDANGIEHESYEAACIYYGADTPASLAAEAEGERREFTERVMDAMYAGVIQPVWAGPLWDDLPF